MTESNICPVCGNKAILTTSTKDNIVSCVCENCGKFTFNDANCGWNSNNKHLIAGYLYETRKNNLTGASRTDDFNGELTPKLLNSIAIPQTSMQRLEKLLLNLYKQNPRFDFIVLGTEFPPAIGYAHDLDELIAMLDNLCDLGYMKHPSSIPPEKIPGIDEKINQLGMTGLLNYETPLENICNSCYQFTPKGLEYCERLNSDSMFSKRVFIAMQFNNPELDNACETGIKPACAACGFTADIVSQNHIGDITDKIISEIKSSRFVVADFTYNNFGVYYEAGYAKGLGIPVIKTCCKKWFEKTNLDGSRINRLHFDIEHDNLLLWETAEDLKEKLENRIRAVIP